LNIYIAPLRDSKVLPTQVSELSLTNTDISEKGKRKAEELAAAADEDCSSWKGPHKQSLWINYH